MLPAGWSPAPLTVSLPRGSKIVLVLRFKNSQMSKGKLVIFIGKTNQHKYSLSCFTLYLYDLVKGPGSCWLGSPKKPAQHYAPKLKTNVHTFKSTHDYIYTH